MAISSGKKKVPAWSLKKQLPAHKEPAAATYKGSRPASRRQGEPHRITRPCPARSQPPIPPCLLASPLLLCQMQCTCTHAWAATRTKRKPFGTCLCAATPERVLPLIWLLQPSSCSELKAYSTLASFPLLPVAVLALQTMERKPVCVHRGLDGLFSPTD